MPKRIFSYAYNAYVVNDDDLQGLLAYALYKRDKVIYLRNYNASHSGQDPSDTAIHNWSLDHSTPEKVSLYKLQASELIEIYRQREVKLVEPELRKVIEGEHLAAIQRSVDSLTGQKAFWNNVGAGVMGAAVWVVLGALLYIGLGMPQPFGLLRETSSPASSPPRE